MLASLLAAHQRGVRVRLLFDVDHPGPVPVPPPPETRPEAIDALPVETRGIAGIPDLMHHKFCIRDGRDAWTGSMNWTEDSWTRQENVVVRVVDSERLAFAFTLAFEELWQRGVVEGTGTVEPRPVELGGGITVRPWFTPGNGEALSHRVAKHIGRARRRIRVASPVLTAGPILGTLVEVVNEGRCPVVGVVDDSQSTTSSGSGAEPRQRVEDPAPADDRRARGVLRQAVDAVVARRRPGRHAREGRGLRRRELRRLVQLLALGRAERRERARDPRPGDRRPARPVRRGGRGALPARDPAGAPARLAAGQEGSRGAPNPRP